MADVFTITIEDTTVVDGTADVKVAVTTGNYYLRVSPFSSNTYTGTHLSKGVWSFGDVNDGIYQLWDDSSQVANYGEFFICDNNPTFTSLVMTGDIDMVGNDITYATSVQCDTIVEKSATNGVSIDGVVLKDGAGKRLNGTTEADNDVVFKSGNQTIAGNKTLTGSTIFSGFVGITGNTSVRSFSIATGYQGVMSDAPSGSSSLVNKQYVDNQIASLTVSGYQQPVNTRRVIYGGTIESNKVYTDLSLAIASCGSPGVEKRYQIFLEKGLSRTDGSVDLSDTYTAIMTNLVNYVNIIGKGEGQALILEEISATKIIRIENCLVYFGINFMSGSRTLSSFTFKDCIIFAYNDLVLNNCKLYNCIVYNPAPYDTTLTNCLSVNTVYNQLIGDGGSNKLVNFVDGFDPTFTMPTDPSLSP